jgi:phenylacetate-coenzyme A ligase PaaK-like adenylate-forming protein
MQLRHFRTQAVRGSHETAYYSALFARLGLDPTRLCDGDIPHIPPTPKEAVRDAPDAFVRRTARPTLRTTTTGTTGRPTSVSFSAPELQTTAALSALGFLLHDQITPEDLVQINTSARATLGNTCFSEACTRIGASWALVGLVDAEHTLALLAQEHHLPGKKPRVSVLQGYAMTETWPCSGTRCEEGHLHFEASQGLLEVLNLESGAPARPSEAGVIVATPFAPYREATVVLRYNTEDVVRALAAPATCSLRHLPATSDLLGKLRLAVRHEGGWTFPREVLEALEAVEGVPLPARYGLWPVADGVGVEVVAPDTAATRCAIETNLEVRGVPLRHVRLVPSADDLEHPRPLRCDLRESLFATLPTTWAHTGALIAR